MSVAPPSSELLRRPVRVFPPAVPVEPLVVATPPALLEPEGSRWITTVLPALSSLGIVGFAVVSGSLLYIVLGVCLAALAVGVAVVARVSATRSRRRRQEGLRARYIEHLDERHTAISAVAARQRRVAAHLLPAAAEWPRLLADSRLWERRRDDPDFLVARLGRGRVGLAVPVRLDQPTPSTEEEADLRQDADDLVALHAVLDDVPLGLALRGHRTVVVEGPMADARPLLRAVVLGLALTHSPDDLAIAAVVDGPDAGWLTRLPHTTVADTLAPLVGAPVGAVDDGHSSGPVVLVVDTATPPARLPVPSDTPVHLLWLARDDVAPPSDPAALVRLLADGTAVVRFADGSAPLTVARPDAMDATTAHEIVEALVDAARRRPRSPTDGQEVTLPVLLRPLLGEIDAGQAPKAGPVPGGAGSTAADFSLTTPLGRDRSGQPVELDLAEAAAGGAGPHGLVVGATGSGKSELLRALLLGLVLRHSPAELALLCWDFKGGAAFAPIAGLPHVRGLVTNLADDPRLVERAGRALGAEIRRRQRLLRDAGVDDLATYRTDGAGEQGALPTLVVVVDEFSELLAAAPDLLDLFVTVGRLGRSLGVHLLLSSQRLDEGRLRGLESHLRFRVCLRTFSSADSRTVLGTDAAHRLPAVPGSGLFAVDGSLLRFDGAYADDLERLVDLAAARWQGAAVPDAPLWLPPLPATLPFEALAGEPSTARVGQGRNAVVVGLVDRPDDQRQDPLAVDLAHGHIAVVGAPRTGRSTFVATLVSALDPGDDLPVYLVGDAAPLRELVGLPRVGAVCPVDDDDQLQALLALLAAGPAVAGGRTGRALLVIDGWARFRARHEDLAELVGDWAAQGSTGGIRLLLTGTSWADFRASLKPHLDTRLEFRLTDPYDSEHGRAVAEQLPVGTPGRLLTPSGHEAQIALPPVIRSCGVTAPAPRPATLPTRVRLATLPRADEAVVLGVSGAGPGPATLDVLGADRQLVVLGDAGSGRSTALRLLLTQLDPVVADLWVIDLRRALLGFVPPTSRYSYSSAGAASLLGELALRLRARLPSEGLTPADLEAPTGGPERPQVLLVDDADLLSGSSLAGSLGGLTELLPLSAEVGLSVAVARRGGARAGFDPSWQALVEGGATGLLLSGSALDGPALRGVRLRPRQPGRGEVVRPGRPLLPVQVATPDPPRRQTEEPRVGEVSAAG